MIKDDMSSIKIIDFGFAAFTKTNQGVHQRLKLFCGTPSYMAPELVKKAEYDGSKVDMWALGVLLFCLLTGSFPFKGTSEAELYSRIMRGWYKFPQGHRNLTKETRQIIQKCLTVDQ